MFNDWLFSMRAWMTATENYANGVGDDYAANHDGACLVETDRLELLTREVLELSRDVWHLV